jgi:DNA segregation ATPase FtsK/SpoIIIE, S-DNA-T family
MIGWNRKRKSNDDETPAAGEQRGELVPFPRRHLDAGTDPRTDMGTAYGTGPGSVPTQREDGPGTGLDDAGDGPGSETGTVPDTGVGADATDDGREVLEGTVVPVDPPTGPATDDGWLADLQARQESRRPVLPAWLRSVDQATAAARWAVAHVAHTVAFHAVRSPLYALKLALRAPVGLFRVCRAVLRWWWDLDGEAVRMSTVTPKPDPETYLRLVRHRDARVRGRTILLVIGLVLAGVGLTWGLLATPEWATWTAAGLLGVLLGLAGGRADRPLAGPATVPTRVQRLSAELVIRALGSLGLAEVNKALAKGGTGITFPAPITRDGPGWRAEVDLPYGVTVTDVVERRDRLASGLRRPLGCVWPEPAAEEHAGRLVLWVGDTDMAKAKAPAWPLARHGKADIFAPLPFGHDQRGRQVAMLLMFSNLLIGAMPRQGKTFALRVLLLACALDPRVQLRVFELKGTGDLSALEKVSHRYGSGADDDAVAACIETLREVANVELARRAKVISGLPKDVCPENKVTPELASRPSLGLFPLVIGVDECQELFTHPTYGKEAEELCLPIIKRGPALGVVLVLATQRPDKDSLPTGISANMGLRFCLRVMGQLENDMVLGTSAYRNGIRATTFTNRDKGIGFLVGNTDDPQIVRSAYLDGPASERVADRARALRAAAGTLTGHAAGEDTDQQAGRGFDLLADLLTVIPAGEEKVWSETAAARLADHRPDVYDGWTGEQLAAALKPYGVPTGRQVWGRTDDGKGANRRGLHRDDLTKAVTRRDERAGGDAG